MHFSTALTPGTALAAVRMSEDQGAAGRGIHQLIQGRAQQSPSVPGDDGPGDNGRRVVGKGQAGTAEQGQGDAEARGQRSDGVAAVMPGIGKERNAVQRTRFARDETKEEFLDRDDSNQNVKSEGPRPFPGFKKSLG